MSIVLSNKAYKTIGSRDWMMTSMSPEMKRYCMSVKLWVSPRFEMRHPRADGSENDDKAFESDSALAFLFPIRSQNTLWCTSHPIRTRNGNEYA